MRTRNIVIVILALLAVVGTIWVKWPDSSRPSQKITQPVEQTHPSVPAVISTTGCKGEVRAETGYCAPDFTLDSLDGKKVTLYQQLGKPTIINFWASWCEPCQEEMPYFQQAYNTYGDRIQFLMVNETSQEYNESDVRTFITHNNYTFPVLLDPTQKDNSTVGIDHYRLIGFPVTFALSAEGKILFAHPGTMSKQQIDQLMKELSK